MLSFKSKKNGHSKFLPLPNFVMVKSITKQKVLFPQPLLWLCPLKISLRSVTERHNERKYNSFPSQSSEPRWPESGARGKAWQEGRWRKTSENILEMLRPGLTRSTLAGITPLTPEQDADRATSVRIGTAKYFWVVTKFWVQKYKSIMDSIWGGRIYQDPQNKSDYVIYERPLMTGSRKSHMAEQF